MWRQSADLQDSTSKRAEVGLRDEGGVRRTLASRLGSELAVDIDSGSTAQTRKSRRPPTYNPLR